MTSEPDTDELLRRAREMVVEMRTGGEVETRIRPASTWLSRLGGALARRIALAKLLFK